MRRNGGPLTEIRLDGPVASVAPAYARLVRRLVSNRRVEFDARDGRVLGRRVTESFGEVCDDRFAFPAKLAWRVGAALEDGWTASRVLGLPYLPRPEPDALAAATEPLRELFANPAAVAGGRIPAVRGWEPWRVIPALVRLFPDARVVIPVKNRDLVRSWVKHLRNVGAGRPVLDSRGLQRDFTRKPGVLVCTLATLDRCRPEDFDLVLVPDLGPLAGVGPARMVRAVGGWDRLTRSHDLLRDVRVPVYGFDPPGRRFSEGEDLRIEAMTGPYLPVGEADPVRYPLIKWPSTAAYTSPRRHHARPDAHRGTLDDLAERYRAEASAAAGGDRAERERFLDTAFGWLADDRILLAAADRLARDGGPAAGVDGVSPAELDRAERADLARRLARSVRDQTYRPGPLKPVTIPKPAGRGTRTLRIPTAADRVLQRALLLLLQPLLDPMLLSTTLGGRPGRSTAEAVARADRLAVGGGRWVWGAADLRKAFDCVPHGPLAECVRRHLGDTPLADLVIAAATAGGGDRGIPQGSPLSPLLLNLHLHDNLDSPWRELHPGVPLLRWVDDVLLLCRDAGEAGRALEALHRLVGAAGMAVKADPAPVTADLTAGATLDWLCFTLGRNGDRVRISVGPRALADLAAGLTEVATAAAPREEARAAVRGWINAYGPAFGGDVGPTVTAEIDVAVRTAGLTGAVTDEEVAGWTAVAHKRYSETWKHIEEDGNLDESGTTKGSRTTTEEDDNTTHESEREEQTGQDNPSNSDQYEPTENKPEELKETTQDRRDTEDDQKKSRQNKHSDKEAHGRVKELRRAPGEDALPPDRLDGTEAGVADGQDDGVRPATAPRVAYIQYPTADYPGRRPGSSRRPAAPVSRTQAAGDPTTIRSRKSARPGAAHPAAKLPAARPPPGGRGSRAPPAGLSSGGD